MVVNWLFKCIALAKFVTGGQEIAPNIHQHFISGLVSGYSKNKKFTIMKNTFLILLFIGILTSCKKESNSPYTYSSESTIYSESTSTTFKEILFIIKPYIVINNQKEYLVAESINNLSLKVNNSIWGNFQSLTIDTSRIDKKIINNYLVSNSSVQYTVIASQQSDKDTLTTAGEYSDLINNFLTLKPGDYICQIDYFDIKLINSQIKRIYPMITVPLEVKENVKSSYIGEFEIEIKN